MSRIQDLIDEFCPDGVEFRALGEVADISVGSRPTEEVLSAMGEFEWINGGISSSGRTTVSNTRGGTVTIPSRGSVGVVGYQSSPFWCGPLCYRITPANDAVTVRFLFHALKHRQEAIVALQQSGSIPALNKGQLITVRVPVPPLEVQREIVRILDTFQSLEAELEAELEARRRQYEHYRDKLLALGDSVPRSLLGEIATIGTGSHDTKDAMPDGKYVFYARGREPLRLDSFDFDEHAVITAGDGVGVGKVFHFANGRYALHQRAYRIVANEGVDARYLYHYLATDFARYLERTSVHSSVTSLRRPMFLTYPVAVPPIAEQRRIAGVLDKFDALTNDLSVGLPAEIKARRRQYEHYRDQLLSFKELVA